MSRVILSLTLMTWLVAAEADEPRVDTPSIENQRMEVMRTRALAMRFRGIDGMPKSLEAEPLFRYDDVPRGYVDGAVWRWGEQGRPRAIVTTELHPRYLGSGPRIVYDFLSLSDHPFSAISEDSQWSPSDSAVEFKSLPSDLQERFVVGQTPENRMFQMKRIMQLFAAHQVVSEENPEESRLSLRLLPRPIDRYQESGGEREDGAIFLFVAGRMPGVIVFLETDGQQWVYGIGRLSAPSTLTVSIDGQEVYRVPPNFGTWSSSYNASNSSVKVPGY